MINTGITFFVLFLSTKFYGWWWDWLPKYLFFLVIGLSAILILLLFKRIRNATTGPLQSGSDPRYAITLAYGNRYEPWITWVEAFNNKAQ